MGAAASKAAREDPGTSEHTAPGVDAAAAGALFVRSVSGGQGRDVLPADAAGSCPVPLDKREEYLKALKSMGETPAVSKTRAEGQDASVTPMPRNIAGIAPAYNVYGEVIDSANHMPLTPKQEPVRGQRVPLSQDRVSSTIPKAGSDSTWSYPSPQMFFSALQRKGKGSGHNEEDMESVVAVHNNMNERTWPLVLEYERLHSHENCSVCSANAPHGGGATCGGPRLSRFRGRVDDLSPKARIRSLFFDSGKLFDRHDWIVTRCDGREVRYVIDYYFREQGFDSMGKDRLGVDVRPALDSVSAMVDRIKIWSSKFASGAYQDIVVIPQAVVNPEADSKLSTAMAQVRKIDDQCSDLFAAFKKCRNEKDCTAKDIAMQHCMAKVVCKADADLFSEAIKRGKPDEAYEAMANCVWSFQAKVAHMTNI